MEILIEDWKLMAAEVITEESTYVAVLRGKIGNKETTTGQVFWLDLKKKQAITHEYIYKLGDCNKEWHNEMKRLGVRDSDIEIKPIEH
jgi:hypothetical protein